MVVDEQYRLASPLWTPAYPYNDAHFSLVQHQGHSLFLMCFYFNRRGGVWKKHHSKADEVSDMTEPFLCWDEGTFYHFQSPVLVCLVNAQVSHILRERFPAGAASTLPRVVKPAEKQNVGKYFR